MRTAFKNTGCHKKGGIIFWVFETVFEIVKSTICLQVVKLFLEGEVFSNMDPSRKQIHLFLGGHPVLQLYQSFL